MGYTLRDKEAIRDLCAFFVTPLHGAPKKVVYVAYLKYHPLKNILS
jgi:hypothetical protein